MKFSLSLLLLLALCPPIQTSAQPIAGENLVLHLQFDNNTLVDASANNHLIINHQTSFTAGIKQEGLRLAGQNNYLEVPHNAALEIPDELSISLWYKHEQQEGTGFYSLVEQSADEFGGHSRYGTWVFNLNQVMACIEPDACPGGMTLCQRCITSNTALQEGVWYHIVSTYDGSSLKLYIDGQLDSEQTYAGSTGISVRSYPLTIGTDMYDANPIYLKGVLDEIRVLNIALTANQVDSFFQEVPTTSIFTAQFREKVRVFPNPAREYIRYQAPLPIDKVRVYDVAGSMVKAESGNPDNQIFIGDLPSGIYLLKFRGSGWTSNQRINIIKAY
ncbi:MAG: LamG-like jellyroll fold domain-containing protein [Bacteroidota bacterium]